MEPLLKLSGPLTLILEAVTESPSMATDRIYVHCGRDSVGNQCIVIIALFRIISYRLPTLKKSKSDGKLFVTIRF